MTAGDAAAAAGMSVVPMAGVTTVGSGDVREGAAEINTTRDYLANHETSGTHPASAITSGTLAVARGGTGGTDTASAVTALGLTATVIPSTGPSTVQADLNIIGGIAQQAQSGQTTSDVYNRNITGTRRSVFADIAGPLGFNLSTRASKQDLADPDWTVEQMRAIPLVLYRYIAEVQKEAEIPGYKAAIEIGSLADDLHQLGLWAFVIYDGRGADAKPNGIHYHLLSLAAIWLGQRAWDAIDELRADVGDLKKGTVNA